MTEQSGRPLPFRFNLDQQRQRAKDLRQAARAGDPAAPGPRPRRLSHRGCSALRRGRALEGDLVAEAKAGIIDIGERRYRLVETREDLAQMEKGVLDRVRARLAADKT